eukprot:g16204.t1
MARTVASAKRSVGSPFATIARPTAPIRPASGSASRPPNVHSPSANYTVVGLKVPVGATVVSRGLASLAPSEAVPAPAPAAAPVLSPAAAP